MFRTVTVFRSAVAAPTTRAVLRLPARSFAGSSSKYVLEVSDDDFADKVRKSDKPVLVDFYANWCGPCRMLTPILVDAAEKGEGSFYLAKVNIDNCPETAGEFRIEAVPTVVAFNKGKVVNSFVGVLPRPALDKFIDDMKKSQ
jgi:thioredoxin 1